MRELLIGRGHGRDDDPTRFNQIEESRLRLASDCVDHGVGRLVEIGEGPLAKVDYPFRAATQP